MEPNLPQPRHSQPPQPPQPQQPIQARNIGLPPPAKSQVPSLRDHLRVLFKHKWKILILTLIGVLASPVAYFLYPKIRPKAYEAKSVLMLRSGREYSSPELVAQKTPLSYSKGEIFSSEILMLRSRELKERIINTIGLERLYPRIASNPPPNIPPLQAAIIKFEENLNVSEMRNSNFIEVRYANEDPDLAARVVNSLVEYYRDKRMEVLADPRSHFFLEKKLAEYRQKLRESEDKLEAFRQQQGFYSFDKQMEFFLSQRMSLEASIKTTESEIKVLQERLAVLTRQIQTIPQIFSSSSSASPEMMAAMPDSAGDVALRSKLMALQLKEQELLGKYTETNQFVVNVRKEIETVKALMLQGEKPARGPAGKPISREASFVIQNLEQERNTTEANIRAAETRIQEYNRQIENLGSQIQTLGTQEKRYRELQREHELREKYFDLYSNKMEEARLVEDINRQEMASITVLQPAIVPPKPMGREFAFPIFFLGGLAGGLGGGIGLAYLLEIFRQGLSTPETVEARLGIPVLATIPYRA